MPNYKEIVRLNELGVSQNQIARDVHSSKDTVRNVLHIVSENHYTVAQILAMNESELQKVFAPDGNRSSGRNTDYEMPDIEKIAQELKYPGVTLTLLWQEYCSECRIAGKLPYRFTQFKKYFHERVATTKFADILNHKPGIECEVDWVGPKVQLIDPSTGEIVYGYVFVASLPFSGYTYVEVFPDMKEESWINAHVHAFEYFGGVTKTLIPDNLKTGILSHPKYDDPELNRFYKDLADYYGTVVIPARVRSPRDKNVAENMVWQTTKDIIAKLRNIPCFNIEEYNKLAWEELYVINHKPFAKKNSSRAELFEEIERPTLIPLPANPYEFCEWKTAKVAPNCHISFEKRYYSVPYKYIGQTVQLKIRKKTITVFLNSDKIAEFPRRFGPTGVYYTRAEDMPPYSNAHSEWNKDRYMKWAKDIGENTAKYCSELFDRYEIEQQAYNGVKSVLMLSGKFSNQRLEYACRIALDHNCKPTYRNVKAILDNRQDIQESVSKKEIVKESAYVRGADYYAKKFGGKE